MHSAQKRCWQGRSSWASCIHVLHRTQSSEESLGPTDAALEKP